MIWFTLGNISVVGTYTTPEQSLTPRGLLAVTAAAALLSCAAAAVPVPYSYSPRDGYSCGGLSLPNTLAAYLISSLQLPALAARGLSSRPALSSTAASFTASKISAAAAIAALILSAGSQLTLSKSLSYRYLINAALGLTRSRR